MSAGNCRSRGIEDGPTDAARDLGLSIGRLLSMTVGREPGPYQEAQDEAPRRKPFALEAPARRVPAIFSHKVHAYFLYKLPVFFQQVTAVMGHHQRAAFRQ